MHSYSDEDWRELRFDRSIINITRSRATLNRYTVETHLSNNTRFHVLEDLGKVVRLQIVGIKDGEAEERVVFGDTSKVVVIARGGVEGLSWLDGERLLRA